MNKKHLGLSIFLLFCVLFTCSFYFFNKEQNTVFSALEPSFEQENWEKSISKSILDAEYSIHALNNKAVFTSPNRQHNLRTTFSPGRFNVKNRIDSTTQQWDFDVTTKGIYTDDLLWAVPNDFYSLEKKENILQYNYNKFSEQYENSKAGLRQNFIVQTVPENTKETRVRLEVKGVEISQVSATELQFQTKESSFNYNDLVVWDKNNTPLYAYFEAKEDNTFDIVVNTSNAVFPITVDPIITSGNPSNANTQIEANQVDALFGSSVSSAGDVNGDGYSDVIVGAPNYDNGQSNEGVVFIFHGSATGISTTPTTILEINQANARFGFSVASA